MTVRLGLDGRNIVRRLENDTLNEAWPGIDGPERVGV